MNYFNIGICDDEEIILDNISKLVRVIFQEMNCDTDISKFNNANDLINFHAKENLDIVFLDIDMPKLDGIAAAHNIKIRSSSTVIIFITSKDELVYESFKAQPFRFIRKSKLKEELTEAILEVIRFLDKKGYKIKANIDKKVYEIDINSILYIESYRNYIIINTVSGKQYKFKDSINKKEHELQHYGFIRTHLGYLVNEKYIQRVENNNVVTKDNQKIPISRTRIQYVQQKLIEYLR